MLRTILIKAVTIEIPDMYPAMPMLNKIRVMAAVGGRIVRDFYPTNRKIG